MHDVLDPGDAASFVSCARTSQPVSQRTGLVTFSRIPSLDRACDSFTPSIREPTMSRRPRIPYPQPNDPLVNLPALCIDLIFSYFSPVELIGFQRVHPIWKNEVNWRFNRTAQWKRWFPLLGAEDSKEYASPEETALAFRRVRRSLDISVCLAPRTNSSPSGGGEGGIVYRHEMRTRGEPTVIRRFTGASQGWTVCGDYFVWVDTDGSLSFFLACA